MILVGSQRGGASVLAAHLLNTLDNDHVGVDQIRGFVADDLNGAFNEAHAISRGTCCKQFLFSLSFNPPLHADVPKDQFMDAIERAERKLGLSGRRWDQETDKRAARYRKGIAGAVDLLFGKQRSIKRKNEASVRTCTKRDAAEREGLFSAQLKDRRFLQKRIAGLKQSQITQRKKLTTRIADVLNITREQRAMPPREHQRERSRGRDHSLDLSL